MKPENNSKASSPNTNAESNALQQLEVMWDRQILKGDDDMLEQRDRIRPEKKMPTNIENHQRRRRKI